MRTGPYTAVREVALTRLEQGGQTERFEVRIGEPGRESSGNPGGEPGWVRKRFTADFLTAFHAHFRREGAKVIAKVARQQPAAYLRCLTMLVPKEMKVEQTGGIKAMTDEQLDEALAALRDLLARREAAARGALASPTVIEGQLASPGLPEPDENSEKPASDADK